VSRALSQYEVSAGDLEVILALVRARTLAEAGRLARRDTSSIFRAVQRTEKGLRQRLFERSRNGYHPTDLALQLAEHAERIETELEAARSAAQTQTRLITGSVRLSTTDTVLHGLVMPALAELAVQHPGLTLELTASNELANLTNRDTDIAVRATVRPPDHVVGRHLGPIRVALFSARSTAGRDRRRKDLSTCAWVAPDDALPEHPSVRWRLRAYPKIIPRYRVNSILGVLEGISAGLGIGVVPLFLTRDRRDLIALSDPLEECETQLWLLTHPESRHLRRIATVSDHLARKVRLAD
jgi:DNA-binding transcriptional LysR family regulator